MAASKASAPGTPASVTKKGIIPNQTVVRLKKPIKFSHLVDKLKATRTDTAVGFSTLFEVKHLTNGGVGGFYPQGATPKSAIQKLAQLNKWHRGAGDPDIIEFTLTGSANRASLSAFGANIRSVTAPELKAKSSITASARSLPADFPGYWEPWRGVSQMIDFPEEPPYISGREFRTAVGWDDRQALDWTYFEIAPNTPDQFVIEIDLKLVNPQNEQGVSRPNCAAGTNRQFWAAKSEDNDSSKLSTGTVKYWISDIPAAAQPYFDYADYEDPCTEQDLSWGVAKPQNLQTDCETGTCTEQPKYHMSIDTNDGLTGGNTFKLSVQRLHNDCNPGAVIAPQCISLPPAEVDEHTYKVTDTGVDYTPLCVGYLLDKANNPPGTPNGTFVYGGSNGVPGPDKWQQGTWRNGTSDDTPESYCG